MRSMVMLSKTAEATTDRATNKTNDNNKKDPHSRVFFIVINSTRYQHPAPNQKKELGSKIQNQKSRIQNLVPSIKCVLPLHRRQQQLP
jgi:hypothetical protein